MGKFRYAPNSIWPSLIGAGIVLAGHYFFGQPLPRMVHLVVGVGFWAVSSLTAADAAAARDEGRALPVSREDLACVFQATVAAVALLTLR